ncbi:MAG: aa3-type cytochrome oxidase subunit IV [Acidimicrobiales bacterium]
MAERPAAGTEGPGGHEARPPIDDRAVPWRVFLAVGAFVLLMAAIYWGTAYEESGTVMLILAAVLSLWISAYLWLRVRERAATGAAGAAGEVAQATEYLPHASVWPFVIGLGAATLANGLVLGVWLIVPGGALMVLGIVGFVRQTRRRD